MKRPLAVLALAILVATSQLAPALPGDEADVAIRIDPPEGWKPATRRNAFSATRDRTERELDLS